MTPQDRDAQTRRLIRGRNLNGGIVLIMKRLERRYVHRLVAGLVIVACSAVIGWWIALWIIWWFR